MVCPGGVSCGCVFSVGLVAFLYMEHLDDVPLTIHHFSHFFLRLGTSYVGTQMINPAALNFSKLSNHP